MTCPFLEYRAAAGERQFDVERAYCTAAEQFVQPMRADICNDRYDLRHDRHCEIYRAHVDEAEAAESGASAAPSDDGEADP